MATKFSSSYLGLPYYQQLGVPKTATLREIKIAFRNLQQQFHLDHLGGAVLSPADIDPLITDAFHALSQDISDAYDILSDDEARAEYDNNRTTMDATIEKRRTKEEAEVRRKERDLDEAKKRVKALNDAYAEDETARNEATSRKRELSKNKRDAAGDTEKIKEIEAQIASLDKEIATYDKKVTDLNDKFKRDTETKRETEREAHGEKEPEKTPEEKLRDQIRGYDQSAARNQHYADNPPPYATEEDIRMWRKAASDDRAEMRKLREKLIEEMKKQREGDKPKEEGKPKDEDKNEDENQDDEGGGTGSWWRRGKGKKKEEDNTDEGMSDEERAEQDRLRAEQAEEDRLRAEQAEQERIRAEQAEQERIRAEQAEQERIQAEQEAAAERERIRRRDHPTHDEIMQDLLAGIDDVFEEEEAAQRTAEGNINVDQGPEGARQREEQEYDPHLDGPPGEARETRSGRNDPPPVTTEDEVRASAEGKSARAKLKRWTRGRQGGETDGPDDVGNPFRGREDQQNNPEGNGRPSGENQG